VMAARTRKSLPPIDMRALLDATDVEHAIVAVGAYGYRRLARRIRSQSRGFAA
jgi:hypothetical protein